VFLVGFNGEFQLKHGQQRPMDMGWPDCGPEQSSYGVCDDWSQVVEQAPSLLTDSRKFVIFIGEVVRAEQPEWGGWRWHKWGPYIGTKNPQHEYLYHDRDIDRVFCYRIIQLMDDEVNPDE